MVSLPDEDAIVDRDQGVGLMPIALIFAVVVLGVAGASVSSVIALVWWYRVKGWCMPASGSGHVLGGCLWSLSAVVAEAQSAVAVYVVGGLKSDSATEPTGALVCQAGRKEVIASALCVSNHLVDRGT